MPRFPPLGVEAVVENHAGYIEKLGSMSRATRDTHGVLSTLGSVPLSGLVSGIGVATAAIAALGAAAVGAGAIIGAALFRAAEQAAPLFDIQQAFEGINEAAGRSSAAVLQLWQDASRGTITAISLMENFNTATQLLGDTLTEQLPDVFPAIAKVAAATGQSVTALTNDLIRGIGRESIMILDNLGITVDLTQVMGDYAASLGLTTEELSKQQRQQALLSAATEALNRNTQNLPDAAATAQGEFASLRVTFQDLKDDILIALVPAMLPLVTRLGELAQKFLPQVAEFVITKLIPALGELVVWFADHLPAAIDKVIRVWDATLRPVFEAIVGFLDTNIPLAVSILDRVFGSAFASILDSASNFAEQFRPIFETIGDFITGVVAPALQIVLTLLLARGPLGLVLALLNLRETFETLKPEFDAIVQFFQTRFPEAAAFVQTAFENIRPVFDSIVEFLRVNIPLAVDFLVTTFGNFQTGATDLFAKISEGAANLGEQLQPLFEILATIITGVVLPALRVFWTFLSQVIFPIILAVADVVGAVLGKAFEVLVAIFNNAVLPAINSLWRLFVDAILPAALDVWKFISEKLNPVFEAFGTAIEGIGQIIQPVLDAIHEFADSIRNFELADFLQSHSPSPLEKTLTNIRKNLEAISSVAAPALGGFNAPVRTSGANASSPAGMSFAPAYNLTVNTAAGTPRIAADFRLMQALSRR